jgi:2-methylcitrate dehydratase PrpD
LTLCAEPRWDFLQSLHKYFLPEVAFKPYPCARQLHAGVEALLKIIQRTSLAPSMIETIELLLPTQNASMMNRPSAASGTASHAATVGSGQYVMAVTVLRGKIDLQSFEDEFLHSAEVRRLMGKVKVNGSPELDRHYPKYWPGQVRVTLSNGQKYSEEIIAPKGESENPMTRADVEEKFLDLAASVLGSEKAKLAIDEVDRLDSRESLEPLLAAIRI